MTTADYIVRYIALQGVDRVFELSGGMITPLLDSAAKIGIPRLVDMRHEQAAGFAAEGWARMKGIPGVAFATSGPGATNLLTAIASCYFDSTPAIFITGNVSTKDRDQGGGRQRGFQDTDIAQVACPISKRSWRVPNSIAAISSIHDAFYVAMTGRRGPVLIDIPFDVLREEIGDPPRIGPSEDRGFERPPMYGPYNEEIDEAIKILREAKRPIALVGGGVRSSGAINAVSAALKALWLPTVHSLMGMDVMYPGHPLRVGMIGSYGNRWANWALAKSDAILALGSRLDIRQTGADVAAFTSGKKIIHVEVDPNENRVGSNLRIDADLAAFCNAIADRLDQSSNGLKLDLTEWRGEIARAESIWNDIEESNAPIGTINPNALMHELSRAARDATAFVIDVGAHQMWAAQSLETMPGQRVITSGGLGAMGFALPAAIGACLASGRKPIVVITGDGSLQVNIQELQTIRDLSLPIKIVVMNNGGHGMVRQFQREVFGGEVATNVLPPSFKDVARAYGIDAEIIEHPSDVKCFVEGLMARSGPALLEVEIDVRTDVYPKLAYGRHLDDMEGKP